jgi:hypothetical protein
MTDFTLTSNLSLKKPNIGGSDGKWGEYINENLETIGAAVVSLQTASTSRTLESLSNVLDLTPTTGQLLQFSGSNWSAATVTIPDNIQDLTNVTITSPSDGQVLAWSSSNSRWENQTPGAATIPDGTITTAKLSTSLQGQVNLILQTTGTPTDNQILRYDSTSTNWQFEDLPGGTVAALSDTDVSGIANKDVLVYNSTSGNWVSRPLAIADVTNLQTSLDAKLETADVTVSSISDTTISSVVDDSFLVYDSSDSNWKNEGPSTVRSTLSLVVGTNVQAQSARLDDISGLAVTDGNIIVGNGTTFVAESGATARASLGLTIGTDVEAYSSTNADYSDPTANFTGTLQNGGSNVLVDSDIGSSVQAYDADTAKYDDTTANFTGTLQNGGSNVVVDSDIGSSVQAWDTQLDDIAALAVTDGNFIVGNGSNWVAESGATARTSLGLGTIATQASDSVSITGGSITGVTDIAIADGGTGASTEVDARSNLLPSYSGNGSKVLALNSGGTDVEWVTQSQVFTAGVANAFEHANSISDSITVSSGNNRLYMGDTTFSGTLTIAGKMVILDGPINLTGTMNLTGTLSVRH